MEIGFVTDEIAAGAEEALRQGVAWGIRAYELRLVDGVRVPGIPATAVQRLLKLKHELGVHFTALSPGVFKYGLAEPGKLARDLDAVLPATFALAEQLAVPRVIVFSFVRDASGETAAVERSAAILREAGAAAAARGLQIVVENEPGHFADSGSRLAALLHLVDSPAVRANWDPANAISSGERPFPEGYQAVKAWIANIHVKDTVRGALVECVPVGEGRVDWAGQISALLRDKPVDHLTIETHCPPLRANSQRNLVAVRRLIGRIGAGPG